MDTDTTNMTPAAGFPQGALIVLTAGQAAALIGEAVRREVERLRPAPHVESADDQLRSIKDIMAFFGVASAKAQQYKNTFLQPAVKQRPGEKRFSISKREARRLYDEEFDMSRRKPLDPADHDTYTH